MYKHMYIFTPTVVLKTLTYYVATINIYVVSRTKRQHQGRIIHRALEALCSRPTKVLGPTKVGAYES